MEAKWDYEDECYIIEDAQLGTFYGDTPGQAHDNYIVALRVANDHARKNDGAIGGSKREVQA